VFGKRRKSLADWMKTRLNLLYHWKAVVLWSVCLACLIVAVAWASIERPDCRWNWNEWWYHHRTTVGQVRWCLAGNHVNINQQDAEGRTILHRIARDLHERREGVWNTDYTFYYEGNSRSERLAMVKETLRWKDTLGLNLDIQDHEGKTAFQYAVCKGKSRQMAALLLKAGASLTLSLSTKERATEQAIPLVQAFGERFNNPFEDEVDFDRVFACESFDCLLNEALKD